MCGFCGEINANGASAKALEAMLRPLKTRGPDAVGVFVQKNWGFGHRRLSIIDLSTTSQQPMLDPVLGLGIVFNGCIYNYRDLRRELIDKGFRFFSEGDTEVILKAYAAWGPKCVERFAGMFAFALWERDSGRVMLARDRLGIKPLYFADTARGFRFASSLPALLAAGDVDTSVNKTALHHYLSWHAVVPAPMTILNGVQKLAPATLMFIEPDGTRREEKYWSLSVGARRQERAVSEKEWAQKVAAGLSAAVKRRTIADVPVGILLSGGLDSSVLVAMLANSGHQHLKTFSIGFDSVGGVGGDEFKYSDLVADRFETDHAQIRVAQDDVLEAFPGMIGAMSEPMMSHDSVAFYILSREVSKSVKVVQSGQGADEIFGGYHWYPPLQHSNDLTEDYAKVYFDRPHAEMAEVLAPEWRGPDYSRDFVDQYFRTCDGSGPTDKALQLDAEIMMVDDPVKRVDNMTMAWGLEARVPFLDHELVELAARIPAELKVKGDGGKYILKQAARGLVPDEIIDRPKGYFPVPSLKYLRGPFLDYVRDVLADRRSRERGIFQKNYVDRLLSNPEGELTPKGHSKLWQIAVLENWFQAHSI